MNSTPPIERLNYFNGQRLEAADFRLEQDFHIRVRRELNKSLFTPGIAAGLAVEKVVPEPSHAVKVLPGLALDSLGREIILVEPREVPVAGKPTEPHQPVSGNYLVIDYAENKVAEVADGCAVQLGVTCKATEDLAWGAPSRIRAEPHISIQSQWPKAEENKIVLAQLELNPDCSVRAIRTFVRKYAAAAKEATAQTLALEGEKDIDYPNPKKLYFHVFAGVSNYATLYLRGTKFSSLYYTELGLHTHTLHVTVDPHPTIKAHTHPLNNVTTTVEQEPPHTHLIRANEYMLDDTSSDENPNAIMMVVAGSELGGPSATQALLQTEVHMVVEPGDAHTHKLAPNSETDPDGEIKQLEHVVSIATAENAGVNTKARSGSPYDYVNDLHIAFDGTDITEDILQQLRDRDEPNTPNPAIWKTLGDGTSSHRLAAEDSSGKVVGTGEIDLLRLGIDLAPGEHWLTFSVKSGGGQIQYNLYIG